jgi:DNA-binding MarR family transcriptional regulator
MMNNVHNVDAAAAAAGADASTVLDAFLTLTAQLAGVMEQGMAARGLTRSRAAMMLEIYRRGPSIQGRLSEALGVTPRRVTGLIDALEGDGLVVRAPHPSDRRATVISLTEKGHATVAAIDAERRAWAEVLFDGVPAGDLATFLAIVERLSASVPRDTDDPRCPQG